MTLNHVPQCRLQRSTVERARKTNRHRDRVSRTRSLETIQKPQPPLRKRQRKLGSDAQPEAKPAGRAGASRRRLDQGFDGRGLEQAADRDLDIQTGANAADQPGRQQRMPPEREEVVVDADALNPQHLGKQRA